jgi:putative chitinase
LYGDVRNLDLVGAPTLAAYPKISLLIACEFWKRGELNDPAAQDDIVTITRRINGGLNRLDSRDQPGLKCRNTLKEALR